MCGISGIVNLNKEDVRGDILAGMVDIQKHRGPDDTGIYLHKSIGLGHRRLSIIDLSKDGHQPMSNEKGSVFIVHNGEIYNYLELQAELKNLGHHFKSRSDTEVILHAYEEWGEECLGHFNGMWALAILDLDKMRLFCARDRFGVKPFYYYLDNNIFVFASEIKALLRHPGIKKEPNDVAISNYLVSGYGYMDISDETFFRRIKQLRPSHYIVLSTSDGKFSQVRYWDIDPRRKVASKSEEEICETFYDLFEDSVRLRLRSDVPLGVSLSGGLDSSSIACVAARLMRKDKMQTFSSCFDDEGFDERKFIKPVLAKTGAIANYVFTRPDKLFDEIGHIIWYQDEPYSTLSIFPQWHVMKLAREKGVKVLLNGQGGDEVLGGYHKYYFYLFADFFRSFKWRNAFREMRFYRDFNDDNTILGRTLRIIVSHYAPQALKNLFNMGNGKTLPPYLNRDFFSNISGHVSTEKKFESILNNDLYNALKISPLPSLLHIDDRSSMAHSIESRAPFLDYRLVEYAFSLGPEYKIRNGITKYILRRALNKVLPEEVLYRKDKMGFVTPLEKWFRLDLREHIYGILTSEEFSGRPYFNHKKVLSIYDDFVNGKTKNIHYAVWSWINLELWLRKFFN